MTDTAKFCGYVIKLQNGTEPETWYRCPEKGTWEHGVYNPGWAVQYGHKGPWISIDIVDVPMEVIHKCTAYLHGLPSCCDSVDTKDESLAAGSMVDSTSTNHLPEPPISTGNMFRDFILFTERIKIAHQAEELMAKHNIAKGVFGVVCALNMMGALKRPTKGEVHERTS